MIKLIHGKKVLIQKNIDYSEIGPGTLYEHQLNGYLDSAKYESPLPIGPAKSSVQEEESLLTVRGTEKLIQILEPYKKEYEKEFGFPETKFIRAWGNKMYKGSFGRAHYHPEYAKIICIFYYVVPETKSANLVFIDNHKQFVTEKEVSCNFKYVVASEPGMAVFHLSSMNHVVSEHMSDQPRISIVLEWGYQNYAEWHKSNIARKQ